MPTNPSYSSNQNDPENDPLNQTESNQTESSQTESTTRLSVPGPLIMGYILQPAKIIIQHIVPPNVNRINNINVEVKDVNFICPDIDIAPLFEEIKQLKETLKHILDTKQLSQEIGNELVGESYLRWDTQVRFYPTIVFIFLESEQDFLKRTILHNNLYKKKVQIKLRITNHTIEQFEKDELFLKNYVINIKSQIANLIETYYFSAGNKRCTYVNQGDVSWKTTIFAKNKQQAIMILTRLCNLIDQKIDPKMFTCTDLRSPNDIETDILVHLHKVSLLVNKKKYPIVLYHV